MSVTYICQKGHEHESHKSQPSGHGQKPVCTECKAEIVKRNVPMFACGDCGHRWYYTGDADRPTCPQCKGKNVEQVGNS